jgi:hypothetical protein
VRKRSACNSTTNQQHPRGINYYNPVTGNKCMLRPFEYYVAFVIIAVLFTAALSHLIPSILLLRTQKYAVDMKRFRDIAPIYSSFSRTETILRRKHSFLMR